MHIDLSAQPSERDLIGCPVEYPTRLGHREVGDEVHRNIGPPIGWWREWAREARPSVRTRLGTLADLARPYVILNILLEMEKETMAFMH